jgi:hypothetical protein
MTSNRTGAARLAVAAIGLWALGCDDGGRDTAGGVDSGAVVGVDAGMAGNCRTTPCGGNLVGTWTYVRICPGGAGPTCPTETVDTSDYHAAETLAFRDDSTFTLTTQFSGTAKVFIPAECLTSDLTCDAWNQQLQQPSQGPGATLRNGSCATSGSGCACTEDLPSTHSASSGTYSTSGTKLITDGSSSAEDYCVVGDTLYLFSSTGTTGTLILVRQ